MPSSIIVLLLVAVFLAPDCYVLAGSLGEETCSLQSLALESCVITSNEKAASITLPDERDGYVSISYGESQLIGETNAERTRERILQVEKYMKEVVFGENSTLSLTVRDKCQNEDERCSVWATKGECAKNPKYMNKNCAPACFSCEQIEDPCLFDAQSLPPNAWQPGDLNRMFERIVSEEYYQQYKPVVIGRPSHSSNDTKDLPWMVILDSFLRPEECDFMIRAGEDLGFERSAVGEDQPDGTIKDVIVEGRTAMNTWCDEGCIEHEMTQQVLRKMENLTGIPMLNIEELQFLRYEEGQSDELHHDFIDQFATLPYGTRILTIYLYFTDVEVGGGTHFPLINITVQPKRGRAVLWPSVLNDDPDSIDGRTEHEALLVEKGTKYGANAWVHQRDYITPFLAGCELP